MADLVIGQTAPNFEAETQSGERISLEMFRGTPIVLYFYPKDDTPGCTKEACSFRDLNAVFAAAGAKIFGVSRDSVASHQKFADKFLLNFPLLADIDSTICEAYGVLKQKNMSGMKSIGIERTTVVIASDGTIVQIFPQVKVDGHVEDVLAVVQALS